jgi:hypothetical protein
MSDINEKTLTRDEFNQALVRALDDLVTDAKYHEAQINASFARSDEVFRRVRAENEERALKAVDESVVRETTPPYGGVGGLDQVRGRLGRVEGRLDRVEGRLDRVEGRLDRIERTLSEIRDRMATRIELEAMGDKIKLVADGYQTVCTRLDQVATLLKVRVVLP